MRFLKSLILVFVSLLLLQRGWAQAGAADAIKQQFANYQQNTLQEKLYAHTDKNAYVAGELIWFKLYYVNAASNQPLDLSKVAYVEVLDADGKAVAQAKIALKEGQGSGSLFIPLSAASGRYTLRAYTNWMKNFGSSQLFEKPLVLVNTLKNLDAPAPDSTGGYAVALFPEGGNLVNGLESNVAAQVTGRDGKGTAFTGAVVTETGDSVATVTAQQNGIGTFLITPSAQHTYALVVLLPTGQRIKQVLPSAYAQGYVMRVGKAAGQLKIDVTATGGTGGTVYLLAHNRKAVQVAEQKTLQNGQAEFLVDTAQLAAGVTHFTLFNEQRLPLCERLFFKKPVAPISLQAAPDQQQYGPRKKVSVALQAAGAVDTTAPLDLSLSVYKWDSLQTGYGDIRTYLWLTSELSGHVDAPEAYFGADAADADNLMLTQGWRRFKWETVLRDAKPAFDYPLEYSGHLIKAMVTELRTHQPAAGIPVFLSIPGTPFQFYVSQSDNNGIAQFDVKGAYGPGELVLQTNTAASDTVYRIELVSPFAAKPPSATVSHFYFSKAHTDDLLQQSISMQVQNIYRKDSLARFELPAAYDTIPFYGQPNYSYALDLYTRFPTMEEVLREYVRAVNVVQRRGGLHMMLMDELRRHFFDGGELVLLDGIPLFNGDRIFSYDPLKVKKLDVITKKYFIGPTFFNGVVSFTTYNGNYEGFQLDPRAIVIDYEGLQLERAFYAPVYETEQQALSRVPDFRTTLLWQPQVATDAHGNATVRFYTSDLKGRYVVAVEGLDRDGNPVVASAPFEVK